jgi:hypothetical protein
MTTTRTEHNRDYDFDFEVRYRSHFNLESLVEAHSDLWAEESREEDVQTRVEQFVTALIIGGHMDPDGEPEEDEWYGLKRAAEKLYEDRPGLFAVPVSDEERPWACQDQEPFEGLEAL